LGCESQVNNLKAAGIDTEFYVYPNLGHGFGLGIGTTAEGWFENAVKFWEKHMSQGLWILTLKSKFN
jgi:acetyl esterase/lipase